MPDISVIVPVYNSTATIERCIDALRKIKHPSFEVILVDDGSTDATKEIIANARGGKFRCFRKENGGPASARNYGARRAKGEILAFTDSDCVVSSDWLKSAQKLFSDGVVGVEGRIDTDKLTTLTQSVLSHGGRYLTANMFYRKGAFMKEMFDERYKMAFREDTDLAIRMLKRGKIVYADDARVYHAPRDVTLKALKKKQKMYYYEALFANKNGKDADKYRTYPLAHNPALRAGAAALALLALPLSYFYINLVAVPVGFMILSDIYFACLAASERKLRANALYLPLAFTLPLATLYWAARGIVAFRSVRQ
ncbi:MAG: glycosyltransferase family 2 protein [Candidatus Aenigmarchaeota archaeon]|nr:glycosyltransferase family 2 protein [Candidatus Aenigmarchaeota archaeon]